MTLENPQLVRILDLVGKPVAGLPADLHSRNADGSLMHEFTRDEVRMSRLTRVYVKREGGHKWLRWEWEHQPNLNPCCYSGIRLDAEHVGDYHLLVEGGTV